MGLLRSACALILCIAVPMRQPALAQSKPAGVSPATMEARGFDHFYGRGVAIDMAAARKWFEEAAAAGRPNAQWMLGTLYMKGQGGTQDAARALQLYRSAAERGVAGAQAALGWMYGTGTAVKADRAEAERWLVAAARQGDAYSHALLAQMYGRGLGVERDVERARRFLVRAAELGDLDSCRGMAQVLIYGPEDQRDNARGLDLLHKAASRNDPIAAYMLGRIYMGGIATRPKPADAVQWMTRAAQAQDQLAALWLSEMHAKGFGVPADANKAAELLRQALAKATVSQKNNFAWSLAVNEDAILRDGALAVRVMQAALTEPGARTAQHLDTLAAAHAEAGDFESATQVQTQVLAMLPTRAQPSPDAVSMQARLASYRAGRPYREKFGW